MKYVHRITISALAKPEENLDDIRDALVALAHVADPRVETVAEPTEGIDDNRVITILRVELSKATETNAYLKFLREELQDKLAALVEQSESRLDDDFDFFIRIDKATWIAKRQMTLTDSGSCFHLKLTLAAFPKNRASALALIKTIFQKNI